MPRAARRKREKEKELVKTAKNMRKLTSFFSTAPTKEVVEPDMINLESVSTLPPTTETPPTFLSHHSDSESSLSDPGPTSSSSIPVAPTTEPSTPTSYDNLTSLPSSTTIVPFVGPTPTESPECSLGQDCQHLCCTDRKPYRPTQEEIKRTSIKQTTKGGSSKLVGELKRTQKLESECC